MQYVEKIERLFDELKKGHNTAGDELLETIWLNFTRLAHDTGARPLLNKIFDWGKAHAATQPRFWALMNLSIGGVSFLADNYDDGLKYTGAALKIFTDMKDDDGVAICSVNLGFVYRSMGEIETALKYGLPGYEHIIKTDKYPMFQIIGSYWIGGVYAETGQLDEALTLFQRGLNVNYPAGLETMDARLTNGIAGVYMRQKKYALALENYLKALELCESTDAAEATFKARGLTDLGDYYFKMNDYAKAISYNEQALAMRREMNILNGAITNLVNLGEIYTKQAKMNDAIAMLSQALKLAEEIKVKAKMHQIHRMLSDIYLAIGNLPESIAHFKAFHEIREDVNHEDLERKVKKQQQLFQAELTQKENAIIKAQKEEIERKNHQLQDTIEELTITKISRRAKAITLFIAVALIVIETIFSYFVVARYAHNSFFITLAAEGLVVLMLKPIETLVERYLLAQVIKKKRSKMEMAELG